MKVKLVKLSELPKNLLYPKDEISLKEFNQSAINFKDYITKRINYLTWKKEIYFAKFGIMSKSGRVLPKSCLMIQYKCEQIECFDRIFTPYIEIWPNNIWHCVHIKAENKIYTVSSMPICLDFLDLKDIEQLSITHIHYCLKDVMRIMNDWHNREYIPYYKPDDLKDYT